MSWSINTSGGSFQTLEELRAHLKSSTEAVAPLEDEDMDELIPDSLSPPCRSSRGKKAAESPRDKKARKPAVRKPRKKEERQEVSEPEPDPEPEVTVEDEVGRESDDETEEREERRVRSHCEDEAASDPEPMGDIPDMNLVVEGIVKDLKRMNTRLSAVCTVMEDVQAQQVSRQYTTLIRHVEHLQSLAYGGQQSVARGGKRRAAPKKK
ncbi:late transcription factor VLTF4 [Squirrelpox virus]|uniref:Late transcription factor VLTF4 n=1 Tax=Squirrelpox virus TaxID=240426 RepID=U3UBA1_9POXV|nr:late transcription factor VLTF4 [Squirrelpox virus]CCD83252.1 late transcription factor VLTF4 [Squirrelpox virus]